MAKLPQSRRVGENLLPSTPRPAERGPLEELVTALVDLDVNGLRLQWRNHLGGTVPAHLPRWLFWRVLAYRLQAAALGGLDKETLCVVRQPKGQTLDSPVSVPSKRGSRRPGRGTPSERARCSLGSGTASLNG
jgi:hypothetical protein